MAAGVAALIRIDAIWLATEPVDMRAGVDTLLARVVKMFGSVRPHHAYLFANRHSTRMKMLVYDGLGICLKRWEALTRYLDDGHVPADNNWVENQIRPWALGRSNWLFAGSLRAGKRAAAIMTLIRSAQLNGHDPLAYLKDVLTRLPTHRAADIAQLLPHRWTPTAA
ncbi:IS66 family insertion sequence element accessory protein TnpB [Paraburkholderia sp. IW21]|uniref:IS66 family insertion sequence element accessory protein TnpB n=1 Tax=Paraburkholderia sp. IW21 TaxID=3242488 RepID=UPI003522C4EF